MPSYSISAPDGNTYTITGPEGASREEVIQEVLSQNPSAGTARTFGGYAKEALLKAPVRGLIGGLEQAAVGASALLPEEMEKPVAAKARELAERFSPKAAPGYEDTVPVKLGEAVGSMGSFLIPGGLPARAAMGAAMGAGEARQRAQQEKATPEQISTATAQGILPGLTDILPIQRLLGGLGKGTIKGAVDRITSAAATGGLEGAQEVAQSIAQNFIAQGYKPSQDLYEGAGEAGGYGFGAGAIAQALFDLALPGRARRGQQPQREVAPPVIPEPVAPETPEVPLTEPQLAAETPQAQPIEAAETAAPVVAAPEVKPVVVAAPEVKPRVKVEKPVTAEQYQSEIDRLKSELPNAKSAGHRTFITNKITRYEAALAAAPGVAPQVDVKTLLKQKKVAPDEPIKIAGARPDGSGTGDAQLVPSDKSKKPGAEATDVAGVGGTKQPAGGLTGGEEVLPDALKVPYKEVSVKDEETSVKVFNEYKQNQKGTTTPGTLNLTDPTIRASQTAVTPARVEAFAKNADLSETLARLDKKEPILVTKVNGKNVIVDGHHRVTAAKLTGFKEVPVHFLEADVKGKIKGFGAKKPKVEAPVVEAKVEAPEVILPERQQKIADDFVAIKDAPEAVKKYVDHYKTMDKAIEAVGFDTGYKGLTQGDMGYLKPRVVEAQAFANWVKAKGKPKEKKALAEYQTAAEAFKIKAENKKLVKSREQPQDFRLAGKQQMKEGAEKQFAEFKAEVEGLKRKSPKEIEKALRKANTPVRQAYIEATAETETAEEVAANEAAAKIKETAEKIIATRGTRKSKGVDAKDTEAINKTEEAMLDAESTEEEADEDQDAAFRRAMRFSKNGTAGLEVTANERTGNLEVSLDGKVIHTQSFANPKLLANFKGDALERVVKERSRAAQNSEEFKNKLEELREQTPLNSYEFRFKAITDAAAGYEYGNNYANKVMESSDGGSIFNIRPSLRGYQASPAAIAQNKKLNQKQIAENIIEAGRFGARSSKGEAAASTGNTKEDVTKALKNHFKEDSRFDALTTVVQSEKDLPDEIRNSKDYRAGTRGVAYKNKVFLVADNIQRGRELGVFLHEAGAHIGFDNIMKPSDRQFLADQVRKWAKGKGDAVETVAAKVALEKGGKNNDEIIAYMTEELVNRGVKPTSFRPANTWLRRVVEAFKKVMTKLGLRQDIAPQELVDLAYGAANIAMDTKVGQELAEFKRIATEVFDEPRFERGKATDWYRALGPHNETYQHDYYGETKRYWETAKLRIGSFGPVNNAAIRIVGLSTPSYSEIELVVYDENIHSPVNGDVVEKFYIGYYPKSNQLEIGTLGVPPESIKVQQKYFDYLNTESGYIKFNSGIVGNITTRTAIRTLRDKALELGYINENTTLHFNRATGATAKNFPEPKTLNYDQIMRFSQANPGMDAVDARTLGLVSGPSAPQSIVQRAYQTALNPRPEKFMQNLRQNFANKNTWWEDWFSSLHGNNALDTAGAASAIDRVQASTKTGGIQLATLEKGGFRKGANGLWEAYDTDASYKDIVEQVSKMEGKYRATPDFDSAQTMFNLAATAKREEGLMASGQTTDTGGGIKRTLDDAQLRQGLAVFNSTPEIREALRLYKKFNDRNVDTLITAGIIDSSLAAELKGNSGYVPWFRFMQDANGDISTKAVKDFSRGLINLSKMQDLEGGKIEDVQIGNILDNMAKLSNWMVGKSIGNDTSAFMVDFAIPYGQAKRVGLPTAGGVDAKKTIQIMRNGVATYYEMSDPAALPAFKGYEAAHGAIVSVLAKPANILRKAITLNPVFSIAQLPQDSFRAFAASGLNNPYAIFPRVMKNFAKELFGGTDTGRELAKYGIVGKGSGMPTEASDNIRRQLGYYDKGAGGVWSRFTDGLEKISSASDEAVRTALYELTLEEGGSQVLALRRAREIINFDTQGAGATSSFLRQTVPFMGVWMNDLNNLYKGLVLGSARLSEGDKNATRAAIVYRGMQLAGLVTLYTLMVGDDDDYKKLDDDTRNRSLIVPGTGFRIPIPNDGIGFLFKVIPEEVTRAVMAQGIESDDAGAKMGRAIWNGFKNMGSFENLLPGAGSPLIKTPVELILNKSFYTGNPIVGKSKEFLAPAEQYTEGTSEIAKQLGAALNLSPIKLDYLVRGLTAQVGGSVLAASNSLFHAATGKVTPSWSGDIKDIPLLGQLGYSRKDKADLEDYYELRHTVDKVARTYRDMIASGRGKEAIEYLTDPTNRKAFALRQLQTQIDKGLAQYRNMEKLIYNNPNLDSDEMRRQLNRVEEMRTKYLQSLRLPKLRAFAEVSPPLDSSAFRILR